MIYYIKQIINVINQILYLMKYRTYYYVNYLKQKYINYKGMINEVKNILIFEQFVIWKKIVF